MSWLLVAFVPGLLMLATFGLGRLETSLARDTVTATDVADFLEQAEAVEMSTLAREGMPEALDCLHRRRTERITDAAEPRPSRAKHHADPFATVVTAALIPAADEAGLPMRPHRHSRANRQFGAPRHADRV